MDAQRSCACRPGSSPRHGEARTRRRGDRHACGSRNPRASTPGAGSVCRPRSAVALRDRETALPSCALSGVMQSQPSINSVASCRSSRSASRGDSGPSASRIASTVRLCWATESGCSHREAPLHRMVRARPAGEVIVGPRLWVRIEEVKPASRLEEHEGAGFYHGSNPRYSPGARRTSFQSPPSIGGRSRANGTLNFSASSRWRSAKRSPGPLASVALQRTAPGSIAICGQQHLERSDRARPHASAGRGVDRSLGRSSRAATLRVSIAASARTSRREDWNPSRRREAEEGLRARR